MAIQKSRGATPCSGALFAGRRITSSPVMGRFPGAFISTNSPRPSPPRFSAQVVSGSPSVSAAGSPTALVAATARSSGYALPSSPSTRFAVTLSARSRSSWLSRCTFAGCSARSWEKSSSGASTAGLPHSCMSSRCCPMTTRRDPSRAGFETITIGPWRRPYCPSTRPVQPWKTMSGFCPPSGATTTASQLRSWALSGTLTTIACRPAPSGTTDSRPCATRAWAAAGNESFCPPASEQGFDAHTLAKSLPVPSKPTERAG